MHNNEYVLILMGNVCLVWLNAFEGNHVSAVKAGASATFCLKSSSYQLFEQFDINNDLKSEIKVLEEPVFYLYTRRRGALLV